MRVGGRISRLADLQDRGGHRPARSVNGSDRRALSGTRKQGEVHFRHAEEPREEGSVVRATLVGMSGWKRGLFLRPLSGRGSRHVTHLRTGLPLERGARVRSVVGGSLRILWAGRRGRGRVRMTSPLVAAVRAPRAPLRRRRRCRVRAPDMLPQIGHPGVGATAALVGAHRGGRLLGHVGLHVVPPVVRAREENPALWTGEAVPLRDVAPEGGAVGEGLEALITHKRHRRGRRGLVAGGAGSTPLVGTYMSPEMVRRGDNEAALRALRLARGAGAALVPLQVVAGLEVKAAGVAAVGRPLDIVGVVVDGDVAEEVRLAGEGRGAVVTPERSLPGVGALVGHKLRRLVEHR